MQDVDLALSNDGATLILTLQQKPLESVIERVQLSRVVDPDSMRAKFSKKKNALTVSAKVVER